MTNASKAPPLSEWPEEADKVWSLTHTDRRVFSRLCATRAEREEYERQCAKDAFYLTCLADEQAYRLPADADVLRAIAARIRESVK